MPCPICQGKEFAIHKRYVVFVMAMLGISDLLIPRHRCVACNLTFTYDFGLGIVQASSSMFRKELVRRCHYRSIADVAREYELPYTTVDLWYYLLAANKLKEEIATTICVEEFALRKGHDYATSILNADTGRILAIVPHRNQDVIIAILQKVTGPIRTLVSDFAPAMANAIQTVYPSEIHVLDRFHLMQFFTDAQQRRRRYLGEAKKHHKTRSIDRCLARKPEQLTDEERVFVAHWHQEDLPTK